MHTPSVNLSFGLPTFAAALAARLAEAVSPPAPPMADGLPVTAAALRADLLTLGVAADALNLALAEAFARLGLPLTRESLSDAHAALVRAPSATPLAYALARALDLPPTPVTLRALSSVTGKLPDARNPPPALTLDAADTPGELAAALHQLARHDVPRRAALLHLAQTMGARETAADALLDHLAGQQIVNEAAQKASNTTPLYFAAPFQMGRERTMLELRLWPEKEERRREGADGVPLLRATVRLETVRLGCVQVELTGSADGELRCELSAERAATARLLARHGGQLAEALTAMGWRVPPITCARKSDFAPLWHGGDALHAPRARVDRKA